SSYLKYTQHTNLYTLSLHDALPISSSTWNQRESLGVHGNFVVPFGEVLQAFLNLFFGGTRSYSKECIREITAVVVQLRRVIISFWFTLLSYFGCFLVVMVNVVRQRTHIVKEFGIHGPTLVFIPNPVTNDFAFQFIDGVF